MTNIKRTFLAVLVVSLCSQVTFAQLPEAKPESVSVSSSQLALMDAVIDERLADVSLTWNPDPAVCVVLTAGGYPGHYETGKPIAGLDTLRQWQDGVVFHAGTAKTDGQIVTKGGRVLGVTATGKDIRAAISTAYQAVAKISWLGMHYRRDIGQRALVHLSQTSEA